MNCFMTNLAKIIKLSTFYGESHEYCSGQKGEISLKGQYGYDSNYFFSFRKLLGASKTAICIIIEKNTASVK